VSSFDEKIRSRPEPDAVLAGIARYAGEFRIESDQPIRRRVIA